MLSSHCSFEGEYCAAVFENVSSVLAAGETESSWCSLIGTCFGEPDDLGRNSTFKLPFLSDSNSAQVEEGTPGCGKSPSDRLDNLEVDPAEDSELWRSAAEEVEKLVPIWEIFPCDDASLVDRARLLGVNPDILRELAGLERGAQQLPSSYLTDAGQVVYDTVYRGHFRHLFSNLQYDSVVEIDLLMNDLVSMLVGTMSATFVYDESTGVFCVREGPSAYSRIVGVGLKSFHSLLDRFLEFGTSLKRLENLCDVYCKDVSHGGLTGLAFGNALSSYLFYVKECVLRIAEALKNSGARGPVHIYHGIEHLWEELRRLEALLSEGRYNEDWRGSPMRIPKGNALLRLLYDAAVNLDSSNMDVHKSLVLCLIKMASQPYLEWLDKWLCVGRKTPLTGIYSERSADPVGSTSVGYLELSQVEDAYDEFLLRVAGVAGEPDGYWDEFYKLDASSARPSFLSGGLDRAVLEAGKAVRLLLAFRPDHALVREMMSTDLVCTSWIWFGEGDEKTACERIVRERSQKVEKGLFQTLSADRRGKREAWWEKVVVARCEKAKTISYARQGRIQQARAQEIAKKQAWREMVENFLNERKALAEVHREQVWLERLNEHEREFAKEHRRKQVEEEEREKMIRKHESDVAEIDKQRKRLEWRRQRHALIEERNQLLRHEWTGESAERERGGLEYWTSVAPEEGETTGAQASLADGNTQSIVVDNTAELMEKGKGNSRRPAVLNFERKQEDVNGTQTPRLAHVGSKQDSNVISSPDTPAVVAGSPASDSICSEQHALSPDGVIGCAPVLQEENSQKANLKDAPADKATTLAVACRAAPIQHGERGYDVTDREHGDAVRQEQEFAFVRTPATEDGPIRSNPFELPPEAFQFESTLSAEGRYGKRDASGRRMFFGGQGAESTFSVPYMMNRLLGQSHANLDAICFAASARRLKEQIWWRCDLINRSALSMFVCDLDLRSHLAILEQFMLMGNGRFVVNLTRVVFGGNADDLSWRFAANWSGSAIARALSSVLLDTGMGDFDGFNERLSFALAEGFISPIWNSFSLETFNFLRIHYRPPQPLDVILTPRILEKYNRVFVFLLRLQRVEVALRRLYMRCHHAETWARRERIRIAKLSDSDSKRGIAKQAMRRPSPLASRTWSRFRLEAQKFTEALRKYVFHVAIGVTWHSFLKDLDAVARGAQEAEGSIFARASGLPRTVSELRTFHEAVVDRMLTRCLLERGQEPLSMIVEGVLSIVLSLDKISATLEKGTGEELIYNEENGDDGENVEFEKAEVEELYNKFRENVGVLVRLLRKQDVGGEAVGTSDRRDTLPFGGLVGQGDRRDEFLQHFLVMLDPGDFYKVDR